MVFATKDFDELCLAWMSVSSFVFLFLPCFQITCFFWLVLAIVI